MVPKQGCLTALGVDGGQGQRGAGDIEGVISAWGNRFLRAMDIPWPVADVEDAAGPAPQKVNRPDANEMTGRSTHVPHVHMQNFFDSIRTSQEPSCPFDIGFRVSIACRMAVNSHRLGRTLQWDAKKEEIV